MKIWLSIPLLLLALAVRGQNSLSDPQFLANLNARPASAGGAGPTNTLAWYVGDTATTQGSSNAVTSWTDNGPNGWHLTNTLAEKMPLRTNSLNGHQVISFLPRTNMLMSQLFTNGSPSECWIVSSNVNQIDSAGQGPFIAAYTGGFLQRINGVSASAGNYRWDLNAGASVVGPIFGSSSGMGWRIWTIRWAGASTVLFTNNVLYNSGDSGGGVRGSIQVGFIGTAVSGITGTDYAELIFYGGTNDAAGRAFIWNYLTNKYGNAILK